MMGWPKGKPNLAKRRPLEVRFWEKVDKRGPDECWIWKAATKKGYGYIYYRPPWNHKAAHNVSMELHGHVLPPGKTEWDHICKNTLCVNPAHLRPATHRENSTIYSASPMAKHAKKTHCAKGHPFSPDNVAIVERAAGRTHKGVRVGRTTGRVCLTCFPGYWRYALIPRPRPPGSRVKPGDPEYKPKSDSREGG